MKLAEALLLRADRNRTIEQLRERIDVNAVHQEGSTPAEDPRELLSMARSLMDDLEQLIRRINVTNSNTRIADGRTLTAAIAERDVLKVRYSFLTSAANAGSGSGRRAMALRSTRTELRLLTNLDVPALRREASDTARQLRELDARIQEVNWTTDLIED